MYRMLIAGLLVTVGSSLVNAQTIPGVGPVGKVQRLHTDFAFTEGPAADSNGNLYFTDIPNNRIHRRDIKGTLSVFAEPSGHCNGLMVVGNRLLACEMDGQLKEYDLVKRKTERLWPANTKEHDSTHPTIW